MFSYLILKLNYKKLKNIFLLKNNNFYQNLNPPAPPNFASIIRVGLSCPRLLLREKERNDNKK
jgi:hypothetical protein